MRSQEVHNTVCSFSTYGKPKKGESPDDDGQNSITIIASRSTAAGGGPYTRISELQDINPQLDSVRNNKESSSLSSGFQLWFSYR
jgi:hypothetical protein